MAKIVEQVITVKFKFSRIFPDGEEGDWKPFMDEDARVAIVEGTEEIAKCFTVEPGTVVEIEQEG